MFWKKKIDSKEYLELKTSIDSLKLDVKNLELDLALVLKKLKFKYKITKRDLKEDDEEAEDLNNSVLLPE